jgi:DNA-binding transcriptional ArsR family regulator
LRAPGTDSGPAEASTSAGVSASSGTHRGAVVGRLSFTPDDVARTRFCPAPAPLMETVLQMVELRRAAAARGKGRRTKRLDEALRAFPPTARPLLDLLGTCCPWPDFLDRVAPDLEESLEEVRATPRATLRSDLNYVWTFRSCPPPRWVRNLADGDREALAMVVRGLRDLHDAMVAPRWAGLVYAFHAELSRRMPVLAAGGHEALFSELDPRLRWRNGGLDQPGADFANGMHGLGLLLLPSASWTGPPIFSFTDGNGRPNVMLYAAQRTGQAAGLVADHPAVDDSLAALIGPTRAEVLRALREPRGTADLADAVRVSPASASEHAKVLRAAHLIETRREGRTVRHSLTALGRTVLGQLPAVGDHDRRSGQLTANGARANHPGWVM